MNKLIMPCIFVFVIGLALGFLFATTIKEAPLDYPVDLAVMSHTHPQLNVTAEELPSLTLRVIRDPKSAGDFAVHLMTENFVFAPEHVSTEHVPGEGHAHIFVDDVKLGRLYGEWYHLPTLTPGEHEIMVSLSTNDHREYALAGVPVMASEVVNVPEDRTMQMDSMPCHQMPDGSWMGDCDES
ncbi:MAG: hypothetical protein OXR66_08155 [Candidatus Woesearchaeota archaeon]|nr:hypothetical protein [Candidatus Woesearchaeota archaeon]